VDLVAVAIEVPPPSRDSLMFGWPAIASRVGSRSSWETISSISVAGWMSTTDAEDQPNCAPKLDAARTRA
jgi:hypothetical protein